MNTKKALAIAVLTILLSSSLICMVPGSSAETPVEVQLCNLDGSPRTTPVFSGDVEFDTESLPGGLIRFTLAANYLLSAKSCDVYVKYTGDDSRDIDAYITATLGESGTLGFLKDTEFRITYYKDQACTEEVTHVDIYDVGMKRGLGKLIESNTPYYIRVTTIKAFSLDTTTEPEAAKNINLKFEGEYGDKSVIVTFDGNGGTPEVETKEVIVGETYGERTPLPKATWAGHTFMGWYDVNGKLITDDSVVEIAVDHTLTAHWDLMVYVINPLSSKGYYISEGTPSEHDKGQSHTFYITVAEGYEGTPVVTANGQHGEITVVQDTGTKYLVTIPELQSDVNEFTITGISPVKYDVTLGEKESATEYGTVQVSYRDYLPTGTPIPSKPGYTFAGFYGDDGICYYGPEMQQMNTWDITSNGKIYAKWIVNNLRLVTYDLNGGSGETPETINVYQGQTFVVSNTYAEKTGLYFGGWTDGMREYQPGDVVQMGAEDITLKAIWLKTPAPVYDQTLVTVTVTYSDGTPMVDAEIYNDGEFIGYTDVNGKVVFTTTQQPHSLVAIKEIGNKKTTVTHYVSPSGITESVVIKMNVLTSSVFEVSPDSSITATVSNLDKEAIDQRAGYLPTQEILVDMKLDDSLSTLESLETEFSAIKASMNCDYMMSFDVSVKLYVDSVGQELKTTKNLLDVAIKFDAVNKFNLQLRHYNDATGAVDEIVLLKDGQTPTNNTYRVDNGWIHIYLDSFSPVAIGYDFETKQDTASTITILTYVVAFLAICSVVTFLMLRKREKVTVVYKSKGYCDTKRRDYLKSTKDVLPNCRPKGDAEFMGWCENREGKGLIYEAGYPVSEVISDKKNKVKLYALWWGKK